VNLSHKPSKINTDATNVNVVPVDHDDVDLRNPNFEIDVAMNADFACDLDDVPANPGGRDDCMLAPPADDNMDVKLASKD
jgi:hypothetical protein